MAVGSQKAAAEDNVSDQKLRDLERRWQASGSVDDEAAFLIERVRAGDLAEHMADLAAFCGHPAACRARGLSIAATAICLRDEIHALSLRFGDQVMIRAILALTLQSRVSWLKDMVTPAGEVVALARQWLSRQDWVYPRRMRTLHHRLRLLEASPIFQNTIGTGASFSAFVVVMALAEAFDTFEEDEEELGIDDTALEGCCQRAAEAAAFCVRGRPRQIIRDALIPWALGRGDPVMTDPAKPSD